MTDVGKPRLVISSRGLQSRQGSRLKSSVLRSVSRCRTGQFGIQFGQEASMAVVASADDAAADWAVAADWVACPLSLVVAGGAVNGVS